MNDSEIQNRTTPRLLVFDWDGTLMDSEAQIVRCLQAASVDLGLESLSAPACRNIIGLGLREAVCTLYPGSTDDFVERYTEQYRVHWFASDNESTLFPGARETVSLLREAGYLLAVATGKSRRGLDRVLRDTDLAVQFHATRCSDETCSKPHPRMLEELMTELNVSPAETLMIGDTEYDMEMARNAGAAPVAVSYGVHELERLLPHRPLTCLGAIGELTDWLTEQAEIWQNPSMAEVAS